MSRSRNRLIVLALLALLVLAFPLLSSVLGDLFVKSAPAVSTAPMVQVAQLTATLTNTASASSTPSTTMTPSATSTRIVTRVPTATPTSTAAPSFTPTPTFTPTLTPTATPRPQVYLAPFVQVFALGQAQPSNSTQVLMYQGGTDIFQIIARQGTFVRLQTLDASLNFWTAAENISITSPLAAQYDYGMRGKQARLTSSSVFACAYNNNPTLAFGACAQLQNVSSATLVARINAGASSLYLAQMNGTQYVIPSSAVASIS